jgi:ureidoglycolate lyase
MAGAQFLMRRIACQAISAQGFAPFGALIDAAAATPELINDGSTRRYADLARLDINAAGADPVIGIYVASARNFPLRFSSLERHRQASQVFIPLGMQRFIVAVAPGGDRPDWSRLAAFLTEAGQGISLHRGTWHHGLIALNDGDRFAVIEGSNYRSDSEVISLPEPVLLDASVRRPAI